MCLCVLMRKSYWVHFEVFSMGVVLKIKNSNIILTLLKNKRSIIFGMIIFLLNHPWVSEWDLKSTCNLIFS